MASKKTILFAVIALAVVTSPVLAGIGSEIPDHGKHYNLNIIGVQHDKTADMNDTHGHTIFVPLEKDGSVSRKVKINVIRNVDDPDKFQVLDRNATDDDEATIAVPFEDYGTLSYNVYATALGKPGGEADVNAVVVWDDNCINCEILMDGFTLKREKGKPHPVDISDIFRASGCIDLNESGECDKGDIQFNDVWVFNVPVMESYLWEYTNKGLKLMQVRFYPTESGSWTPVP